MLVGMGVGSEGDGDGCGGVKFGFDEFGDLFEFVVCFDVVGIGGEVYFVSVGLSLVCWW